MQDQAPPSPIFPQPPTPPPGGRVSVESTTTAPRSNTIARPTARTLAKDAAQNKENAEEDGGTAVSVAREYRKRPLSFSVRYYRRDNRRGGVTSEVVIQGEAESDKLERSLEAYQAIAFKSVELQLSRIHQTGNARGEGC